MGRPKRVVDGINVARLTAEALKEAESKDLLLWAHTQKLFLPAAGKEFTIEGHEYLEEPYSVNAPFLIFNKGAQLGFSERAILKAFHDCYYRLKTGLIYYFPTKSDVTDFSKARFGPMISENPVLKDMVKDTDSANIKRVGKCMLYLRGLRSAVSAKSAPADKLVFDELDEAPPEMVDLARKRLDHSEFQEIEALSTPTIPDFGIDSWFQLTDQRYRQIFCEYCFTYTCLERDFPNCLVRTAEGVRRVCKKCRKPLNMAHPKNVYVADFPNKEYRGRKAVGYRISQLQSQYVDLENILEEYENTKFPADFYNSRLAQAYIDASNRLDVSHVLALCGSHGIEYSSKEPCAVGVDIGPERHHVVVARKEYGDTFRVIFIGETDWAGLDLLIDRYNGTLVLDGLPEPDRARWLAGKHPYKVYACFYMRKSNLAVKWDETTHVVHTYQSQAMDASHGILQMGKVVLPKRSDLTVTFAQHCHNIARKKVEDEESGEIRYQWIKLGADHYRKAFNFMVLAGEKTPESSYSSRPFTQLAGYEDDFVSSYGWK